MRVFKKRQILRTGLPNYVVKPTAGRCFDVY